MATFEISTDKTKDQNNINIRYVSGADISSVASMSVILYLDDLETPVNTYVMTAGELALFKANDVVELGVADIFGGTYPSDGFYTIKLDGDTASFVSNFDNFGITKEATALVYSKQNLVTPMAPDYYIIDIIHVGTYVLRVCDNIEDADVTAQKERFDAYIDLINQLFVNP